MSETRTNHAWEADRHGMRCSRCGEHRPTWATPSGECTAERSEPAAASVPLLIDQLADRLEDWAQNEEMIDQFFLGHGKDCNEAAKLLRALSSAPGERTNKEKL
jgi:hypothetical protein